MLQLLPNYFSKEENYNVMCFVMNFAMKNTVYII